MTSKVYCPDCVHRRIDNLSFVCVFGADEEMDYSSGTKTIIARSCSDANRDGSCKDFEKQTSIWRRIFGPKGIKWGTCVSVRHRVMALPKDTMQESGR
jgi:hypothetical protein